MFEWGSEGADLSDALNWLKKNPDRIGDFVGDVLEGAGDAAGDAVGGLVRVLDAVQASDPRLRMLPKASDAAGFFSDDDAGKSKKDEKDDDRPEAPEAKARRVLREAGMDKAVVDKIMELGGAQFIIDTMKTPSGPAFLTAMAATAPDRTLSAYAQARVDYGFDGRVTPDTFAGAGGPDAMARNLLQSEKGYRTNESGALLFDNGVIADPTTGDVFFPPNNPDVAGSFAWVNKVQKRWSEAKINEWRKRLSEYGYDVARKGPLDQLFLSNLQQYHRDRYLNGGTPLPVDAALAGKSGEERIFDPAEVRNAVTQQYRTVIGDDPSESELESWEQFIKKTARRLVNKKGYDPAEAAVATEERFIEKFESDPKVQFLQEAEDENTELRDGLLGVLQTINAVAR